MCKKFKSHPEAEESGQQQQQEQQELKPKDSDAHTWINTKTSRMTMATLSLQLQINKKAGRTESSGILQDGRQSCLGDAGASRQDDF